MFPAIHDPQAGVLFLHPLLIPVPGTFVLFASAPKRCLYLVARLCAQCPTTTEAQEGNVNLPPTPLAEDIQQPICQCCPHQEGFEAGTQGPSHRWTVGAEPLYLVPTHGLH